MYRVHIWMWGWKTRSWHKMCSFLRILTTSIPSWDSSSEFNLICIALYAYEVWTSAAVHFYSIERCMSWQVASNRHMYLQMKIVARIWFISSEMILIMRNVNVLDVSAELGESMILLESKSLILQKLARCLVCVYTERDEYEYDLIYSNWSICICVYRREVDAFVSNGWYVLRLTWEYALWKS